jgi:hypothetical protein
MLPGSQAFSRSASEAPTTDVAAMNSPFATVSSNVAVGCVSGDTQPTSYIV